MLDIAEKYAATSLLNPGGTMLEDFVSIEEVGRKGRFKHIDGRNVFEPN